MRPAYELLERWVAGFTLTDLEAARVRDAHGLEPDAELGLAVDALVTLSAALEPAAPPPQARARLLEALASGDRFEDLVEPARELVGLDEATMRRLFAKLDSPRAWHPGPIDGIEMFPVRPGGDLKHRAMAGFLRVEPGVTFPDHTHHGDEVVFILQGSCRESVGGVYRRGQRIDSRDESHHDFTALPGPPLIVLAVMEGHIEI